VHYEDDSLQDGALRVHNTGVGCNERR